MSKLAPNKDGGYIQISAQGCNKFAILQEVVLWAKGVTVPEPRHEWHISHLCDTPSCILPEHMVLETPSMNNSRKNCGQVIQCAHVGCQRFLRACKHDPPCIVYVEGFKSLEDFNENGLHCV